MDFELVLKGDKSPMETYTGRLVYPPEMTAADVDKRDIAHALSLMCRGGGHISHFFSVAQHCINCAMEAYARGYSRRVQLGALLHDGSEAYMSDIIRPVKSVLPDYKRLEEKIEAVVYEAFSLSLSDEERALVREIDNIMLHHEFLALKGGAKIYRSDPPKEACQLFDERKPIDVEIEFLALLDKLLEKVFYKDRE